MAINYPESHDEWLYWTRLWWDSILGVPKGSNPINDQSGENFKNFKQPADAKGVWFLAGNLGGEDVRNITVKKGKALFFPEVNYIGCKDEGYGDPGNYSEEQNSLYFKRDEPNPEQDARKDIDAAEKSTNVDYDGAVKQRVRKRVPMPFWKIEFADPPIMGRRSGTAMCLSDGYWIFTEPLDAVGEKASITIKSGHSEIEESTGRKHSFSSKVVYKIDIVS